MESRSPFKRFRNSCGLPSRTSLTVSGVTDGAAGSPSGLCSVVTTTEQRPEGEPAAPSVTPETVSEVREGNPQLLRKRLKGDLDSILLTALRKEPSRRYSSVESF